MSSLSAGAPKSTTDQGMRRNTAPLLSPNGLFHTLRRDTWWVEPMLIATALIAFTIYAMWAILQGQNYAFNPYLSPFYSPRFLTDVHMPYGLSTGLLLIWIPLGFRATCYYFRRAYYKAFFLKPPSCAVGDQQLVMHGSDYTGESKGVLFLQNAHRFFFYLAAILVILHWTETIEAFKFETAAGSVAFGAGPGTLLMLLDSLMITGYVFSCHAWRHLIGGKLDCFSCSKANQTRHGIWKRVTALNENHAFWAWASMATIVLVDVYIRLCATGVLADFDTRFRFIF